LKFDTSCTFFRFVSSQPEDELLSLLQSLADMDIPYKALQVKTKAFYPHSSFTVTAVLFPLQQKERR
jgi:hypothetical protein